MNTSAETAQYLESQEGESLLFWAGSAGSTTVATPLFPAPTGTGPVAGPVPEPAPPALPSPGFLLNYCGYRVGEWPDSSLDGVPGARY